MSLVLGILFGVALEKAGFGSSRRLSGIFYFKDMAVLKVMFTALITAMLGLLYAQALGLISVESVYLMPTIYGAQIIGGLLFGIGFVMSGWCPGTAAVGLASGKWDALICILGAILGSILFNETFHFIQPLYTNGNQGILFLSDSLHLSKGVTAFLFTIIGIAAFWGVEKIEQKVTGKSEYLGSQFLKIFSFVLFSAALGLMLIYGQTTRKALVYPFFKNTQTACLFSEQALLQKVEEAQDHIAAEELAERLLNNNQEVLLVDVRPENEYANFHIKGAVNIRLSDLSEQLIGYKNQGIIVLYSNGMTHPAQARDSLNRQGFNNVYILTDGLLGFVDLCLKPVALRSEPVPDGLAQKINLWRGYFLGQAKGQKGVEEVRNFAHKAPGLIDTQWLSENYKKPDMKILDLRSQNEYNTSHIPGSLAISPESFRGVVKGVPSVLLPAAILSQTISLMGIKPNDFVVLVYGEKPHDATLVSMVFERLGHENYGILNGGFLKWQSEGRLVDTELPKVIDSSYRLNYADNFTVYYKTVLQAIKDKDAIILDVRPQDYYLGQKSDEARAGHIPGAINRPYTEDIRKADKYSLFKTVDELTTAYKSIIPTNASKIIVHCRTGHQASQTFFILKNLLGYTNVYWYDGGWTEWSARKELPIK
ncbi:MAG: YeeE/YedE family protein [Candidatus Omnitrophica bacterium]|nr:YeeE/YedE family protein [Candidatus Omnitrophota bacterium]